MSDTIKSAYELALERIILPSYGAEIKRQQQIEEENRIDRLPDFIDKQAEQAEMPRSFVPLDGSEDHIVAGQYEQTTEVVDPEPENQTPQPKVQTMQSIHYGEDNERDDIPEIYWHGSFTSYTGFSRMNRTFVFGLANRGIRVKLDMQSSPVDINQSTMNELEKMSNNVIAEDAPKIFGATIPLLSAHPGKKILYTMIENSQTLHRDYKEKLNLFDEIWVPTEHGKKLFLDNGVCRPVYVMPLGVDTDRYNDMVVPLDIHQQMNPFVFLSVFKWNYRKGWDILLRSYLEEFVSDDPVTLLIVSRTDVNHDRKKIVDDVKSVVDTIHNPNLPHIVLYDKPVHERNMPGIYALASAFVLISRGEGMGLPYLEAAACGMPVIASNCSGQSDFLKKDNSFLVDPEEYVKADVNGTMSRMAKHCRFYEGQMFPLFEDKSIAKTREHMRYVFENYDAARMVAKNLSQLVREQYTWDNAIEKVYNRILEWSPK